MSKSTGSSCSTKPSEADSRPGDSRATFFVPQGCATKLVERPISTKGGLFHLKVVDAGLDGHAALQTVFYSPKPERTAESISKVIARRIADPDGPDVECVIS
eukprot:TRINITY_DN4294_c0_g1_i4.p1 TRINITY_DN4294_c0_g1~~TRINITY_DN4294_c0_g1_i4.p1  ORF type:complete len:119 (-),score=19.14 TRINITY_DN4294_c0_g1_i4:69-374(-)